MTTESMPLTHVDRDESVTKSSDARQASRPAAPSSLAGMLWFAGWLFTIGFAQLVWWKALLALCAWPYFLGVVLRG